MITATLEWLAVPFLGLAVVTCIAWFLARWHTYREIGRAYEKLCLETGEDIF